MSRRHAVALAILISGRGSNMIAIARALPRGQYCPRGSRW